MVNGPVVENFVVPSASLPVNCVNASSWWRAFEGNGLFLLGTPSVFLYSSHYILKDQARAQRFWGIVMSEFSIRNYLAFLCLARDCSDSPDRSSNWPWIWDSVCWCCFCLVFLKTSRNWVLLQSRAFLVCTCPGVMWRTVVLATLIGRGVRRQGLPVMSVWVRCLMFRRMVCLQPCAVMLKANPKAIEFYLFVQFLLELESLLIYRLLMHVCVSCFPSIIQLRWFRCARRKYLNSVLLMHVRMSLMLKASEIFKLAWWSRPASNSLYSCELWSTSKGVVRCYPLTSHFCCRSYSSACA